MHRIDGGEKNKQKVEYFIYDFGHSNKVHKGSEFHSFGFG